MHMASRSLFTFVSILIFAAIAALGIFYIHMWTYRVRIDPQSYAYAGSIIKEKFPQKYDMFSDDEVGRNLYGKGFVTEEQKFVLRSVGLRNDQIDNLVIKKPYTQNEKILYYTGFLILWLALCVFTFRIFKKGTV